MCLCISYTHVLTVGQCEVCQHAEHLLVILRGIPGSGKSHLAKSKHLLERVQNLQGHGAPGSPASGRLVVCSADDFFVDPKSGEYRFDRSLIREVLPCSVTK